MLESSEAAAANEHLRVFRLEVFRYFFLAFLREVDCSRSSEFILMLLVDSFSRRFVKAFLARLQQYLRLYTHGHGLPGAAVGRVGSQ